MKQPINRRGVNMLNSNIRILFVFIICGLLFWNISIAGDKKEEMAAESAKAWLTTIDDGKYAESWESAADYFKNAVSKEQWKDMLSSFRKPLGKVMKRKIKSKEYRTTLPGAPDGEYVVVQYETSFSNKKYAIETVTPMLDKDGKWRVSGYFIK
jgi:hypothetical protein